jgi:hypothetical protein
MKKLLETLKQKWAEYLLEIFVIVFGILIAFMLNDWNEGRKVRKKEREILIDLVENLGTNIKTIKSDIENLHELDRSSEIVLSNIYNQRPYVDSLATHFHRARVPKQELFLSQAGYEGYKDNGLQILTNKDLKAEVLALYELTYPKFFARYKMVNAEYPDVVNHAVQNFVYANLELVPVDYPKLLDDHYYISWIRAYKEGRKSLIRMESDLLNETQRVRQLIKDELK